MRMRLLLVLIILNFPTFIYAYSTTPIPIKGLTETSKPTQADALAFCQGFSYDISFYGMPEGINLIYYTKLQQNCFYNATLQQYESKVYQFQCGRWSGCTTYDAGHQVLRVNIQPDPCSEIAGDLYSQGTYTEFPSGTVCPSGSMCEVSFTGAPLKSMLVDGVVTEYLEGQWLYGSACSESSIEYTPNSVAVPTENTCGSGDSSGDYNGKFVCVSPTGLITSLDGTVQIDFGIPSPSTETKDISTDPVTGDVTTTTTNTTINNGISTTTTTTQICTAQGSCSTTVTTNKQVADVQKLLQTAGDNGDLTAIGSGDNYSGGENTSAKNSMSQAIENFSSSVANAPFVNMADNFFTVSVGGTCPVWSADIPLIGTIVIDQFCSSVALTMYSLVGAIFMLLASFVAFRWAVL